jgi:hypothetical protein
VAAPSPLLDFSTPRLLDSSTSRLLVLTDAASARYRHAATMQSVRTVAFASFSGNVA